MSGVIYNAGEIVEEKIVGTLEKNYMPYAMSVITSRAIPEIDGFKPSHRKLLFTMYKMGLLGSARTKSANIVGQTMKLNPHGDSAIYDTMVRMSRGYEALLHPYVDSKGNFGKFYSRDMACAASRYTEAKLENICKELFKDIDKDTVDFVPNYDNTLKEPSLLPCTFPSVLVNSNTGIAVGMASSICPFNLKEVCETAIGYIKNPEHDISSTLLAPDFPGGGEIIYDKAKLEEIYKTGRGGIKVRARYKYDKKYNCIDVVSIPPTTTSEIIIEKIVELVKAGKIREISDIRDETGLDGLKITIDLKRGVDADKLMIKLFRLTPLEDTFSCNFNILVGGTPKVMGVREILEEWTAFRAECIRRRTAFDLAKKKDKLHLLEGLNKILVDIDKAIAIIRKTEEEQDVVPNLMKGFGIDEVQAEFVAEIKLRHLNREYILKRTSEIESLRGEIEELENILSEKKKIYKIIVKELTGIAKEYGKPRKCLLISPEDTEFYEEEIVAPDYPVRFFITKEGYFKKITPQSLKMNSEQKLKIDDEVTQEVEGSNHSELLFFTDKCQVYKAKGYNFSDTKASSIGEFIPAALSFDKNEKVVYMAVTTDYQGFMLFVFAGGKVSKVDMKAYETKTNRKKLIKAYSDLDKLVTAFYEREDKDFLLTSSSGKILIFGSSAVNLKQTKNTQGVAVMKQKKGHRVVKAEEYQLGRFIDEKIYRAKNIPASGKMPSSETTDCEQLTLG
ncbi:MAG: DNA topoisomerase (ATP-hydrolyzing) subunit A [Clostridia bacterium]|nr:DNA topoisomerase (ATP-hydrolyzing) subunit A [Clostridia bacterium]